MSKNVEKSRVTDLISEVDLNVIEDININVDIEKDESVDDAAMKNISIQKIKQKAMAHAEDSLNDKSNQRQVEISIEQVKQQKSRKHKGLKRSLLIPLIALITLIGTTLAAFQSNGTLGDFFGELFPYEEQVQVVGMKQVKAGIIYTVEGAFVDNHSGVFIVSMTKEDGSAFEVGTQVRQMQLQMEKSYAYGSRVQSYLQDDNKKLMCVMELSCNRAFYKQEIALQAENLVKQVYEVKKLSLDLNKIYEEGQFTTLSGNEENWYNYDRKDGLNLHLVHSMADFSIDDVRLTDKGLSILTSYEEPEVAVEGTQVTIDLVDTRTGKVYERELHTNWDNDAQLTKNAFVFKDITADDLPYLQVKYGAHYEKMIVADKWEIQFKLNKNSQVISKKILRSTKVKDDNLLFTQIEVSALGVTLKGYGKTDQLVKLGVAVMMKDGEEKRITYSGSSGGMGRMTCYYDLGTNEDSHIPNLITIEDVVGVKINGKVIKMKH